MSKVSCILVYTVGMSVDIKLHIDIGSGYIDIELLFLFRKLLIGPAPN
jgi:hypothetical protein